MRPRLVMLADSSPLFLERGRLWRFLSERREVVSPRVAYVGAANGDDPQWFELFKSSLVVLPRAQVFHVVAPYRDKGCRLLSRCDWVFLAGGDPWKAMALLKAGDAWQILKEHWRQEKLLMGLSAGAMMLGESMFTESGSGLIKALDCVPYVVEPHGEKGDWKMLKLHLRNGDPLGLALPLGAAVAFDHHLKACSLFGQSSFFHPHDRRFSPVPISA